MAHTHETRRARGCARARLTVCVVTGRPIWLAVGRERDQGREIDGPARQVAAFLGAKVVQPDPHVLRIADDGEGSVGCQRGGDQARGKLDHARGDPEVVRLTGQGPGGALPRPALLREVLEHGHGARRIALELHPHLFQRQGVLALHLRARFFHGPQVLGVSRDLPACLHDSMHLFALPPQPAAEDQQGNDGGHDRDPPGEHDRVARECLEQRVHVRKSPVRVMLQGSQQHPAYPGGDAEAPSGRSDGTALDGFAQLGRGTADERKLVVQGFVAGGGEAELVGARIEALASVLLGRHVAERAGLAAVRGLDHRAAGRGGRPGHRRHGASGAARQAEIGDPDPPVGPHENVAGLEVTMDDAGGVCSREPSTGLDVLGEDLSPAPGLGRPPLIERGTIDELHREIESTVVLVDVVHTDDVRMGQLGQGLGLATQLIGGHAPRSMQFLDRDLPIELLVVGGIDDPHATLSEGLEHGVAFPDRDRLLFTGSEPTEQGLMDLRVDDEIGEGTTRLRGVRSEIRTIVQGAVGHSRSRIGASARASNTPGIPADRGMCEASQKDRPAPE